MRILVTGGFGFLGGRVGFALREAGHEVIFGAREPVCAPEGVEWGEIVQTGWEDERVLEGICRGVDVVVHAAGMNAADCAKDPVGALLFNGVATARLARAAVRSGVGEMVYFSTAHVYGAPLAGEITEDTLPRNEHPYATTHLAGEMAVLGAVRGTATRGVVLRLSNVFGRPVHSGVNCWGLLVNDLCRQAVVGGEMVLRTAGRQKRDFLPMGDFLRVVVGLVGGSGGEGKRIYNLGGGKSERVLVMAERIRERVAAVFGKDVRLVYPEQGGEAELELAYRIAAIRETGCAEGVGEEVATIREIDELLGYCAEVFGKRRVFA